MRRLLFCTALVLLCGSCALNVAPKAGKLVRHTDVMIPMPDGVELAANITLPDSQGNFPVIIVRTPYGKGHPDDAGEAEHWASRGYAHVFQDCRGTGNSGGKWEPGAYDKKDGLNTHKWVLQQPWCNGKIATAGGSYLGYTQVVSAPLAGDYLKAMFTVVPLVDWYKDVAYVGGAFRLQMNMGWGSGMLKPTEGEEAGLPEDWDLQKAYWHLPLSRWDETIGYEVDFMRDWIAHPIYDDYWSRMVVPEGYKQVRTPNITVTGWYDIFINQAFDFVSGVIASSVSEKARKNCHLIVGPWGHKPNWIMGKRDFGKKTRLDAEELQEKWFDHWLKGQDTGVEDLPPYRIFVMGKNFWRDENEWPLERTQYTKYYFHSGGSANTAAGDGSLSIENCGDEPGDSFLYDPKNPVPTRGGCNLLGAGGPLDQRVIEKRQDVLVYTSEELKEELEVTGPVKAVVYASSSATDTDWTAKLVDVYPDGRAFNLCDGIIRARYRNSATNPTLIKSGQVYRYEIDLWVTSNVFLKGHRIRVEISSSNFPRFDRNPNTGHKFGADAQLQKANQIIYHNSDYPSHIVLSVIPN